MVFVVAYDKEACVTVRLGARRCLDSLAQLHALAPQASIAVREVEEYKRVGPGQFGPTYTALDWEWRPVP